MCFWTSQESHLRWLHIRSFPSKRSDLLNKADVTLHNHIGFTQNLTGLIYTKFFLKPLKMKNSCFFFAGWSERFLLCRSNICIQSCCFPPPMLKFHKQGMFSPAAGSRSPFSHSQITQKHNYSSAYFNYDKLTDWYDWQVAITRLFLLFSKYSIAKKFSLFLSAASVSSIFLKWVFLRVYAPILSPLIDLMSLFFHLVTSFFTFLHLSLTLSTLAVTVCARAAGADESLIICRSEASSQPLQQRCTDEQMPFRGNVLYVH